MNIAIITNMNGIGLQRDCELLTRFLVEKHGHNVFQFQYDGLMPEEWPREFDLAIFLEVVPRNLLELAPIKWAFLNPEWCKPDVIKTAQRHIDKVFAKTHEAKRIFDEVFPGKAHFTGFLTREQYDPGIERRPWFLHIGGNSSLRGTQAVIDAWKWKREGKSIDAHLIVISRALKERPQIPMVTYYDDVDEEHLRSLQNQCLFHIYPSGTEGFGHALHESLSVGAILMTTGAPPMNEVEPSYKIQAIGKSKYNLADVYEVSALDIHELAVVLRSGVYCMDGVLRGDNILGRGTFHSANASFKEIFSAHLEELKPAAPYIRQKGTGLQIAFIGNFKPDHSTENQLRWALEEGLGHDVETLQENEVNLAAIRTAMEFSDMLFWVRTPGWLRVHDREMLELLASAKIPTVSVHLDKFWGIPDREALIGVHPFFKTQFVFTADGSRQEDFKARGVNHFWMRPAVSEVYCHPGTPWDMYRCDVGFVGAKDYHSEYPFRKQLVEFLEKTYGDRFKHITGLRGHALNDFYASCKVVVGDCIFAGTPRYWSDRVPETCGRHGFLLHPQIDGLEVPVAVYHRQDLEDLQEMIEMYLEWPCQRRKNVSKMMADHVKRYDTWTVRMKEILEIVQEVKPDRTNSANA